jgi:hypothetical protein
MPNSKFNSRNFTLPHVIAWRPKCGYAAIVIGALLSSGIPCSGVITCELISPGNGNSGLIGPPEAKVWLRGVSSGDATVRFYRRVLPPADRTDFTVVALPDTQHYVGNYGEGYPPARSEIFSNQIDWIVDNRVRRNIAFVAHVGDLVLSPEIEAEWLAANNAMSRLENPLTTKLPHGIPYSICVGNHDGPDRYTEYNRHFGVSRFANRPYYGGNLGNDNKNHYSLFSAGGMDFIVLSLEWLAGTKPPVMSWANSVLSANSHRRAIVLNHSLLRAGYGWSVEGLKLYDSLKGNPNIFLMLCGHDPTYWVRKDVHDGNTVTTVLSDYSGQPNGGNGWLRTMRFSPSLNRIFVQTYSPWLDQFRRTGWEEFVIDYNMDVPTPEFSLVATRTARGDEIVSGGVWTNLLPSSNYEWYVTVEQNGQETRGATWRFKTNSLHSAISYPQPSPEAPFAITEFAWSEQGFPIVRWNTVGGQRYRVEFSNGSGDLNFTPIVRPESVERDFAPEGVWSEQQFMDDGSLTGGLPASRFYRILRMEPLQPLKITRISKPANGHPAIMWNSVGGRRYRVQYSDGNPMVFKDVVRPASEEIDPAETGTASYQVFVDDGSKTGGSAPSRFYRVYEVP